MRNIRFINKSMFILVVFSIFMLSACSNETEPTDVEVNVPTYKPEISIPEEKKEEVPAFVEMEKFSYLSTELPKELEIEYWDNIPMVLYSTASNVSFDGVAIGNTREEMESVMNAKYEKFYSIHDPENPNIGWYVLNDNLDIVIFDFDLEDESYVNFETKMSDPILKICVSNLKYFD